MSLDTVRTTTELPPAPTVPESVWRATARADLPDGDREPAGQLSRGGAKARVFRHRSHLHVSADRGTSRKVYPSGVPGSAEFYEVDVLHCSRCDSPMKVGERRATVGVRCESPQAGRSAAARGDSALAMPRCWYFRLGQGQGSALTVKIPAGSSRNKLVREHGTIKSSRHRAPVVISDDMSSRK
jgi:hypothetical protein